MWLLALVCAFNCCMYSVVVYSILVHCMYLRMVMWPPQSSLLVGRDQPQRMEHHTSSSKISTLCVHTDWHTHQLCTFQHSLPVTLAKAHAHPFTYTIHVHVHLSTPLPYPHTLTALQVVVVPSGSTLTSPPSAPNTPSPPTPHLLILWPSHSRQSDREHSVSECTQTFPSTNCTTYYVHCINSGKLSWKKCCFLQMKLTHFECFFLKICFEMV